MCLAGEPLLIKTKTVAMGYFTKALKGVDLLVLFIGIYHSFIVRD